MILIDEISPLLYTHMRSTQMWWNGKYSEKKCFLSNIARKGGGALPPQPAVVYFSKQMYFLAWQMGRWFTKSDNRDVDGEVQTFLPTHFLETFILEKWKLTNIRFGSTMEVINREVIIFVAPGQQVAAGFASISRSRVVNFWNVHHCHCWKE